MRGIVWGNDVVVKRQSPEAAGIERRKTIAAKRVAEKSGLFTVPEVVDFNEDEGTIVFERISGMVSLDAWIASREDTELLRRMGGVLSLIHKELVIDRSMWREMGEGDEAAGFNGMKRVPLHGDASLDNFCYLPEQDRIVVIDWLTTRLFDERDTVGPWGFDVGYFVFCLFYYRPRDEFRKLRCLAEGFLEGYWNRDEEIEGREGLWDYWEALNRQLTTKLIRGLKGHMCHWGMFRNLRKFAAIQRLEENNDRGKRKHLVVTRP